MSLTIIRGSVDKEMNERNFISAEFYKIMLYLSPLKSCLDFSSRWQNSMMTLRSISLRPFIPTIHGGRRHANRSGSYFLRQTSSLVRSSYFFGSVPTSKGQVFLSKDNYLGVCNSHSAISCSCDRCDQYIRSFMLHNKRFVGLTD